MAAQLSPRKFSDIFVSGQRLHVPARVLTAVCVAAVVISLVSVIVGAWDARRDEDVALARYADAEALLALPPVDTTGLQQELDAANLALATAQALAQPPSVDPSSDAATSLLVRRASDAGLTVRGIASVPDSQVKNAEVVYDVSGLRMTVEGGVTQVIAFLEGLGKTEPGLIPSLTSMTVDDKSVAHAEIVFNVYTLNIPPTPAAAPTARSAR